MAITNRLILDEIEDIKSKLPNGEFVLLKKSITDLSDGQLSLKEDIRDLKKQLLDPDDGVIVRVNKNSEFRKNVELRTPQCQEDFDKIEYNVSELMNWKGGVSRALWILFTVVVGIILRILFFK
jgi:tetrahydromethanopterin S-methyltransferase subunit G|tara:strand:+ start:316 stop:687 length:372 start_codon:yes stop_codon:yes gene_type:complete